jgi:hypothetical protein
MFAYGSDLSALREPAAAYKVLEDDRVSPTGQH